MGDHEINHFLHALENESNSSIINLTTNKIKTFKNNILQKLGLDRTTLKTMHKKLKDYRYCSDMSDILMGYYIRWIPLKNPDNLTITNGGLVTGIDVCVTGTVLTCKNHLNRFFRVKMDEAMIFKRLTNQERVILAALKYLS